MTDPREAPRLLAGLFPDGGAAVLSEAGAANWLSLLGPVSVERLRALEPEDLALRQLGVLRDHYAAEGDYGVAVALTRALVQLRTQALGRDHPDVVLESAALGALLQRAGQPREGAQLLDRAWELLRSVAGGRDLRVAVVAQNVAAARLREGATGEAEHALEVALRIRRAVAPTTIGLVAAQLGELRAMAGRPREAVVLLREALATTREREGADSVRTVARAQMLGVVLNQAGLHAEAAEVLRRVYQGLKGLGEFERQAAVAFELGLALHRTGVREEALRHIEESVRLTRQQPPEGRHASLANRVTLMAEVHVVRGRLDEAEGLLREALELDQRQFGAGSRAVALRYAGLAQVLGRFGRIDEALGYFDAATSLLETEAPADDPQRIEVVTGACRLMLDRATRAAQERDGELAATLVSRGRSLATLLGPNHAVSRGLRDLGQKLRV